MHQPVHGPWSVSTQDARAARKTPKGRLQLAASGCHAAAKTGSGFPRLKNCAGSCPTLKGLTHIHPNVQGFIRKTCLTDSQPSFKVLWSRKTECFIWVAKQIENQPWTQPVSYSSPAFAQIEKPIAAFATRVDWFGQRVLSQLVGAPGELPILWTRSYVVRLDVNLVPFSVGRPSFKELWRR